MTYFGFDNLFLYYLGQSSNNQSIFYSFYLKYKQFKHIVIKIAYFNSTQVGITKDDNLVPILLGVFIPLILIVIILIFGIFRLKKTKKILYYKNKLKKSSPIDDNVTTEANELQSYGSSDKSKLADIVDWIKFLNLNNFLNEIS